MRLRVASSLLLLVVHACGCGDNFRVDRAINLSRTGDRGKDIWTEPGVGSFKQKRFQINPYTFSPGGTCRPLYAIAADARTDAGERMEARNRLQEAIILVSDDVVAVHLSAARSGEAFTNLFLGITTSGLAGAGALSPDPASKVLAGGAALTNSSRSLFNETVYRNMLVETITASIEIDRRVRLQAIRAKQADCITSYSVDAAMADAVAYHEAGSIYRGLELVRQAAEGANRDRLQRLSIDEEERRAVGAVRVATMNRDAQRLRLEAAELQQRVERLAAPQREALDTPEQLP